MGNIEQAEMLCKKIDSAAEKAEEDIKQALDKLKQNLKIIRKIRNAQVREMRYSLKKEKDIVENSFDDLIAKIKDTVLKAAQARIESEKTIKLASLQGSKVEGSEFNSAEYNAVISKLNEELEEFSHSLINVRDEFQEASDELAKVEKMEKYAMDIEGLETEKLEKPEENNIDFVIAKIKEAIEDLKEIGQVS